MFGGGSTAASVRGPCAAEPMPETGSPARGARAGADQMAHVYPQNNENGGADAIIVQTPLPALSSNTTADSATRDSGLGIHRSGSAGSGKLGKRKEADEDSHRRRHGVSRQSARGGVGRGGARRPRADPRPAAGETGTTRAPASPASPVSAGTPTARAVRGRAALDGADARRQPGRDESIADGRLDAAAQAALRDSRIVRHASAGGRPIVGAATPPPVFISGSGVGYYGASGDEPKTEASPPGDDFLAHLCVDWEAEARRAESARHARRPAPHGPRARAIRRGAAADDARRSASSPADRSDRGASTCRGSTASTGSRWCAGSWRRRRSNGPVNATAPHPVTNREFARALGRALHRPSLLPAPGFALKIVLGEMADAAPRPASASLPARAQAHGYHFRYPEIDHRVQGDLRGVSARLPETAKLNSECSEGQT